MVTGSSQIFRARRRRHLLRGAVLVQYSIQPSSDAALWCGWIRNRYGILRGNSIPGCIHHSAAIADGDATSALHGLRHEIGCHLPMEPNAGTPVRGLAGLNRLYGIARRASAASI